MACALALPQHAEANKFLASTLIQGLKAKGDAALADCVGVLDTMARVEHPETVDFFLKFIDKFSQRRGRHYYLWWLARIVPQLPPSAAPQIEAALPNLPDAFVDEILPCLETLKTR